MEICNVAVKYEKIKIGEGIFIYKFIELLKNVEYNSNNNSIIYYKNDKKHVLFEMEDPEFNISDDKFCFSDYLEVEDLFDGYSELEKEEMTDKFEEDCKNFLRYGVFDSEKEEMKIVNTNMESIIEAEPDSFLNNYVEFSISEDEGCALFPRSTILGLIKSLEDNKIDVAKNFLVQINSTVEQYKNVELKVKVETKAAESENKETLEELLSELSSLIGLENIKEEVDKLSIYLKFLTKVKENTNLKKPNLNMVFTGNPGSGKTTVAKILAKILHNLGYVSTDKFLEATSKDFIAGYVGQTAIKTNETIEKNKGGVILIDEAYAFASETQKFSDDALSEILKEMEKNETIFIFCGYEKEMEKFINMNSGISSRIGYKMNFKDYNLEELLGIFIKKINDSKLNLNEDAIKEIKNILYDFSKKENFGNGRFISNLFDKVILTHAKNVDGIDSLEILTTITEKDILDTNLENMKLKEKTYRIGY